MIEQAGTPMSLIRLALVSIGLACLTACASTSTPPNAETRPVQATGKLTIGGIVFAPGDIADVKVVYPPWGTATVQIDFTPDGHRRFGEATAGRVGQELPIILDGHQLSAPILREAIAGNSVQIAGSFSSEEATTTAERIKGHQPSP